MLIWMNGTDGTVGIEHGIVRAEQVQTLLSAHEATDRLSTLAHEALEAARAEAEGIVSHAHEQAQALVEEAHASIDEARRQGYEEGMRHAIAEWHDRQARGALNSSQSMRAMHEKLAEIVTTAVERIVSTESRGALYERALRNVQTLTRGATSLKLRVSPADYEQARASIEALGEAQAAMPVEVMVDPGLKAGSCIFESDQGVLDASLETQLDGLRSAMERAVRAAVRRGDPETDAEHDPEPSTGHGEAAP